MTTQQQEEQLRLVSLERLKDLVIKTSFFFWIEGTFAGQLLMWLILWKADILVVHNLL